MNKMGLHPVRNFVLLSASVISNGIHKIFLFIIMAAFTTSAYPSLADEGSINSAPSDTGTSYLSLKAVLNETLQNNPELKAARNLYEARKARIPQAGSLEDPWISIEKEKIPKGTLKLGSADETMYGVQQMIPFPTKLILRGKVASTEANMAWQDYLAKEREIIAKVKNAYYELYMIQKSIDINEENKILLRQFEKIAETKYSVGTATQQDVLKAQVELSKLINELITLEQEKETAKARLNALLNRPIVNPMEVPKDFESPQLDLEWSKLENLTLEHRPELKAVDYLIKRTEAEYSLAKASYLPDFMFRVEQREMEGNLQGWDGMFGMTVPLWFMSKQRYAVKEALANIEVAMATYYSTKNMVLFEVKDSLVRLQTAERLVNLYKTSILPQARQTVKSTMAGYETNKVDFLTLIDAQRLLKDFQLEYYRALVDYEQSLADLERSVGTDLVKVEEQDEN